MSMFKSRQCRQQHIKNTNLKLLAKQRTIGNALGRVQDRSTSTIVFLENEKGGSCTSSSGNWTTGWGEGDRSSGVLVDDRAVGGGGSSSGGGGGGGGVGGGGGGGGSDGGGGGGPRSGEPRSSA